MSKCKNCQRELIEGEVDYCPACSSDYSHRVKQIVEVVTPLLIAAGAAAYKIWKKK